MTAALLHPDDDLPEGTSLAAGRFCIEGFIGLGSSGVVHAAIDHHRGAKVALKILATSCLGMPDREARFEREARIGVRVPKHANLVAVRDAGHLEPPDGRPYLVLDYVRGPTLAQLASNALAPALIVSFARDMARGLQALHAGGIVHRDLKPGNVLIDKSHTPPVARITDFGLALATGPQSDLADDITRADARPGTPIYMAPEQFAGVRVSFAADVYALGATLYEVASGLRPFAGATGEAVVQAKRRGDPPGAPLCSLRDDLPDTLVDLIEGCMRSDPGERPSIDAVVDRLEARRSPRPRARSYGRFVGIVMLGTLGLAIAWLSVAAPGDAPIEEPAQAIHEETEPVPTAATANIEASVRRPVVDDATAVAANEASDASEDEPADTAAHFMARARRHTDSTASKPNGKSLPRPRPPSKSQPETPSNAAVPAVDCAALRVEADDAAQASRWAEVLERTRGRECWPDTTARARLRVRANAELRRWPACIREGGDLDDSQIKSWLELCVRKAMDR